jgi:phage-related protein
VIIIELFKIFGSVFLQTDEANKSLENTTKKAESTGSKLSSIVGTAATVGAGIATGVAAGAAALFGLANNSASVADEIDKLSKRTGINVEELQRWKYAASQSGADIGTLENGIKKLSDVMVNASSGNKNAVAAFDQLGISLTDLKTKSQEDIFGMVMNSLANMEQGAERNALGNDLLGKSYTELLPLLNEGSNGMDALKQRANELGLVMSKDAVNAGVVFGDTMADVKDSFGAIVTKVGTSVMPIMQQFLDFILSHMPTIQSIVSKVFDVIGIVVSTAANIFSDYLLPALTDLYEWIEPYIPQIQAIFQQVFTAIGQILRTFMTVIGQVINYVKSWFVQNQSTVESIKNIFITAFEFIKTVITTFIYSVTDLWRKYGEDIVAVIKVAWEVVAVVFKTAIDLVSGIFKTFTALLKGDWSGAWNAIKETLSKVWENIKGVVSTSINLVKSVLGLGLTAIKDDFSNIWNGIKNIVVGIWDGIEESIKGGINNVIGIINNFIKKVNSIKIKIPSVDVPGVGTMGGGTVGFPNIKEIPMLAEGGTIQRAGRVLVGEQGAELLDLPKGARVTPLDKASEPTIVINISGNTLLNDRDADRLGDILVRRLKALGVR